MQFKLWLESNDEEALVDSVFMDYLDTYKVLILADYIEDHTTDNFNSYANMGKEVTDNKHKYAEFLRHIQAGMKLPLPSPFNNYYIDTTSVYTYPGAIQFYRTSDSLIYFQTADYTILANHDIGRKAKQHTWYFARGATFINKIVEGTRIEPYEPSLLEKYQLLNALLLHGTK